MLEFVVQPVKEAQRSAVETCMWAASVNKCFHELED